MGVFLVLPLIYADLNMKILYYCNENLMRIPTANNRSYKHYKLKNKTSRHITVMRIWGAMFLIVMNIFLKKKAMALLLSTQPCWCNVFPFHLNLISQGSAC